VVAAIGERAAQVRQHAHALCTGLGGDRAGGLPQQGHRARVVDAWAPAGRLESDGCTGQQRVVAAVARGRGGGSEAVQRLGGPSREMPRHPLSAAHLRLGADFGDTERERLLESTCGLGEGE
jgi:hypothetical protein